MMHSPLSLILALSMASGSDAAPTQIEMGDGQIDGKKVTAYEFTWSQCQFKEGKWQTSNPLTEKATIIGDLMLRIEQSGKLPNGIMNKASYFLNRETLSPIVTERAFRTSDGKVVASQHWAFDENGYQAKIFQQGKNHDKTGTLSSKMYDAMILGVPLSTLNFETKAYALKAFMTNFNGTYALVASKTGEATVNHAGKEIALNWIDVKWHHEQSGDIYPAGPDASGGRYWITREAHPDLPRIIRYQTDSYAIEYLPNTCPAVEEKTEPSSSNQSLS